MNYYIITKDDELVEIDSFIRKGDNKQFDMDFNTRNNDGRENSMTRWNNYFPGVKIEYNFMYEDKFICDNLHAKELIIEE